jgi:non-specific serine/threonine protein kinase
VTLSRPRSTEALSRPLPPSMRSRVPSRARRARLAAWSATRLADVAARELEVAQLVEQRLTNREIAEHLVLSARTVEHHIEHIFDKLGVDSRVAVARAIERARRG